MPACSLPSIFLMQDGLSLSYHPAETWMLQQNYTDTVLALRHCHDTCLEAFTYCARIGGKHMAREHVILMESCIELCQTTANFLLRYAPLTEELCSLCASICKQCATSCNALNDMQMNRCAIACQKAAHACRNESQHMKAVAA